VDRRFAGPIAPAVIRQRTKLVVVRSSAHSIVVLLAALACSKPPSGDPGAPDAIAPAPPPSPPPPPALPSAPPPEPEPPRVELPRDAPGRRSFGNPAAPLPPLAPRAQYESPDAACPTDMVLVDGLRCATPEQLCLRWLDPPGRPQRSCAEFAPSRCTGKQLAMRFCIDRLEYTPPGYAMPLVHVSFGEAERICRAHGKRICGEAEWEFACEGPDALAYPYGNVRNGALCNHDRDGLFDARGKLVDQRAAADSLPGCKSPFGVMNLVGNVDEWTLRAGRERPWRSILRGGWWLAGRNRCRAATESHNEIYAGPQTGFRCCKGARR
jgi:formylglycine-generating enzyme